MGGDEGRNSVNTSPPTFSSTTEVATQAGSSGVHSDF